MSERGKTSEGVMFNKSGLVSSTNPETVPFTAENQEVMTVQKLQGRNKYFWMMDKSDPLRAFVKKDSPDTKRINYYQYSM